MMADKAERPTGGLSEQQKKVLDTIAALLIEEAADA